MAHRPRTLALVATTLAGLALTLPLHEASRDDAHIAASVDRTPRFSIAVRRNTLTIEGHSPSLAHEARIREIAARSFPGLERRLALRPYGPVPNWWSEATSELLAGLQQTVSPSALLSPHTLHISALVDGESDGVARLRALRALLPPSVDVQLRLAPRGSDVAVRTFCERHFAQFEHGAVNFEESGTAMRSSAFPVLDRVVALADACRGAVVSITGHTDSSGNEALNRQLSLARAEAVRVYLQARGLAESRIVAAGVGSAEPIADNATRYGRSLNRRIEISFSYAD